LARSRGTLLHTTTTPWRRGCWGWRGPVKGA